MSECVRVMVRVRPMNKLEKEKRNQVIMRVAGRPDKTFAYDYVFGQECSQESIYQASGFGLVESAVQGYNGTIFAYGQTGCGKTFTMMGAEPQHLRGVIPRSFAQIIRITQSAPEKKFLVRVAFIQIYNEQVHDLLSKNVKEPKEVKENPGQGFYVKDVSLVAVRTVADMEAQMNTGFKARAVGETIMNKQSSRSHSIFTVLIETQEGESFTCGKLNFVDLAGSEKQSKTGAEGDRFKEAVKINLSLSTLGNVISSLVDGKTHIPYRVSKLTKLLQDSLGGNTKTIMFANLSPAEYNMDETLSTLHYASRAKFIQNKPKVNQDPKDALLKQYLAEINELKAKLQGTSPALAAGQFYADDDECQQDDGLIEQQLKETQAQLEQQRKKKQLIQAQLKTLGAKLVGGSGDPQKQKRYEEMQKRIKRKEEQHERLVAQNKKRQEALLSTELVSDDELCTGLTEETDRLRALFVKLRDRMHASEFELKDVERRLNRQKYELIDAISQNDRDLVFMKSVAQMLLRPDMIQKIRSEAVWDEQDKTLKMPVFRLQQAKPLCMQALPQMRQVVRVEQPRQTRVDLTRKYLQDAQAFQLEQNKRVAQVYQNGPMTDFRSTKSKQLAPLRRNNIFQMDEERRLRIRMAKAVYVK